MAADSITPAATMIVGIATIATGTTTIFVAVSQTVPFEHNPPSSSAKPSALAITERAKATTNIEVLNIAYIRRA